jgi:hypothetical protein
MSLRRCPLRCAAWLGYSGSLSSASSWIGRTDRCSRCAWRRRPHSRNGRCARRPDRRRGRLTLVGLNKCQGNGMSGARASRVFKRSVFSLPVAARLLPNSVVRGRTVEHGSARESVIVSNSQYVPVPSDTPANGRKRTPKPGVGGSSPSTPATKSDT